MNVEQFRPIIHAFFDGQKTFESYMEILKEHRDKVDIRLLETLRFMIKGNKIYPVSLRNQSRKIILNILRDNCATLEADMERFIKEKDAYYNKAKDEAILAKVERAVNQGEPMIRIENMKNDFYWTRILSDMNDDDYEEVIKNLLVIREEMKRIMRTEGERGVYTEKHVDEYIDLEFIRRNLYYKQYQFSGLFYYIYNFLLEYMNPAFERSLENSRKAYFELLEKDCVDVHSCSNETTLELIKFLMDTFFIYIELNDSMDIIPMNK